MKNQIKEANNLIEVAKELGFVLKKVGKVFQTTCFRGHDSKTLSLTFYLETLRWYCFGCGRSGDVIDLVMAVQSCDFKEAMGFLAKRAGLLLPSLSSESLARFQEEGKIHEILDDTAIFYHKNLTEDARSYLTQDRALTPEIIDEFALGYANGGLKEYLLDELKHPLDLCLKAGVLKQKDSGTVRDYFYQHIILPNIGFGHVVYMSGRLLGEGEPKYIHLPGGIKHLYNEPALSKETVYLAEGQIDVLTLIQNGYNAAGVMGVNNFKEEWMEKFSRCKTVYVVFDGDQAGKDGALRVARILGNKARIVSMPTGMDVNEFFRR